MKSSNQALVIAVISMCTISLAQNAPKDFLEAHNEARAEVGVEPLTWNDTLAAYAENYANSRIKDCKLEHSQGPYGENIAEGYGEFSATDAVKLWLSEKSKYDHKDNTLKYECMHYTQVIWNTTVNVGCARAKCNNGWIFIICSYYPPGNFIGQQPY